MSRLLTARDPLLHATWEPMPQGGVGKPAVEDVQLALRGARPGAPVRLWLHLAPGMLARLGWAHGDQLGLKLGRGVADGWLMFDRLAAPEKGMPLRTLGPKGAGARSVFAMFEAGELARFEAPRHAAEWRLAASQPAAILVVRLPWDFSEAREAAAAAAEAE